MPVVKFTTSSGTSEERTLPKDEILFIALEERGTELRHGCLSGSCGTCKINVTKNPAGLSKAGAIEQDTINAIYKDLENYMPKDKIKELNLRLACRAKLIGDISFEPFEKPKEPLNP